MATHDFDQTARKVAAGGLSCMVVSFILNPADLIKVRMVTQAQGGEGKRLTFSETAKLIARNEGIHKFWTAGIPASMMREASYSSLRMGLYEPVRHFYSGGAEGDAGLLRKIAAGATTGAVGSAIATPTDLVKIRFQGHIPGQPFPYRHTFHAFQTIFKEEGIQGLYRGTGPTMVRAAILTSAQMSSYDHTKHVMLDNGFMDDGPALHLFASIVAGLVTTTAVNPSDVIKTRWMNALAGQGVVYKSPLHCLMHTIKTEGVLTLWRGWLPNYLRLGPHFIMSFPLFELIRKSLGVGYLT